MRNIFEFATKELSQDAFLSWFIANCNEPGLEKDAYDFINKLTYNKHNFKPGDIKEVQIKQQENNMDIIVDFWTTIDKEASSHYVMIIEDKTNSSAHSGQLKKYANEMNKWNTDEPNYKERRHKIFYKANNFTDQDKDELSKGNEGYPKNDHWKEFDIKQLYEFFSEVEYKQSEILNSYVEHINQIYNDLNISPIKKPISSWNFNNYTTFFSEEIEKEFKESSEFKQNYHSESWQYQGRLVSVAYYYHAKEENKRLNKGVTAKYPSIAYPLVEFVFRKYSNKIIVYTHISYHWIEKVKKEDIEIWAWKYKLCSQYPEEAEKLLECLRNELKQKLPDCVKIHKMEKDTDQTISTDSISLEGKSNEEIKKEIMEKLVMYFEVFEEVDKSFRQF